MSSTDSPKPPAGPPSFIPTGLRSRRTSSISNSTLAHVDKEQLAQALDKIHITASHSNSLTTFNEFSSPPPSSSYPENKSIASDLVQNGLSGLYSRFRGAVTGTKDKSGPASNNGADQESVDNVSIQSQSTPSKLSLGPLREESASFLSPVQLSRSSSHLQSPTASSFASEAHSQLQRPSKQILTSNAITSPATSKSTVSNRPSLTQINKATTSSAVVPSLAPVNINAFKESDSVRNPTGVSRPEIVSTNAIGGVHEHAANFVFGETRQHRIADSDIAASGDLELSKDGTTRERVGRSRDVPRAYLGGDGSVEITRPDVPDRAGSALSSLRAADSIRGKSSSRSRYSDGIKRPAAIERITQSHLPGYQASRTSSTDRSTAETSPINTSAHNNIRHDSFSVAEGPRVGYLGRLRIPGTTMNEGAPEAVSARLEQMRKQVLSKEFWMADEICKECFLCGDTFSAFRRKHHCRTCGCIFDSKCTQIISGQRFGVQQGSLRVCKTCLDIINRRHDSSGSEDSEDESALPTFFHSQQAKFDAAKSETLNHNAEPEGEMVDVDDSSRPLATPMMAIPATRRIGDSTNRRSAILEIDAIPQLSRPSSSRSLKTLSAAGRPPSSGHKRHHSKHNFLGRFKTTAEERAPFHRGMTDETYKKSRLPAFHDDNIIDPDLAPYMSDEGSSADEQMSIFATMNSASILSPTFDNDRVGFGSLLNSGKKHRTRTGDKSVSGLSFTSRGLEDAGMSASMGNVARSNRRRNPSTSGNNFHHSRLSIARPAMAGFPHLNEEIPSFEGPSSPGPTKMTRSVSMRDAKAPAIELNNASLHHVRRLLHQLLEDHHIPNVASWEKALIPILLQCTDDVNPDIRHGDDIDIRHYVKLKKIPGGRPGDTAYVSGVVFTKNLALKSMPRSITNPRIVIVSFAIEYARHQHHFMSLEPVIAQEKEFLKNMVNRIASLRPQLLLVQKHISGLALQYLAEANIAVAYNVKPSVIEAVSRCCQTEIISSIDMVALKPVHIGKSAGFDVKTYVHKDIPGKKKTYVYLSGCPKEVGCTIVLRGASMATLSKMKSITEFMVYVVYNLKLETCLMRDEFVLIPSVADNSGSISPNKRKSSFDESLGTTVDTVDGVVTAVTEKLVAQNVHASEIMDTSLGNDGQNDQDCGTDNGPNADSSLPKKDEPSAPMTPPKQLVSLHQSHAHGSHDDHLPEDVPAPTFYSDMVAKHQTKILSASPFVKFAQPYLLMKAREQERKVTYYKGLRDQDTFEEQTESEKSEQTFQMILPEMLTQKVTQAPRTLMEAIHAAHDAEYDKALHNYQTQKRQWENYIQGNLNLFDPYSHQNITVLYTVVCTATTVPCAGPDLLAMAFYNEHAEFDPDCTLGQYVEDLCLSVNTICTSNGCERKMSEHHRTYVHGEARITVFVEKSPCKIKGLQDSILMWSYCKICKKETQVMPMSESTWKYSLGKYLELSFWSSELRLRAGYCPHDIHKDHIRYFGYHNVAMRIHYDPIDLLEIIVPRTRVTWKVANDVVLKNKLFNMIEDRWNRFMISVKLRITGINMDSVASEKAEACRQEIERLNLRAQEEHVAMIRKLQEKYVESKYYEIIPLNRAVRAMQEKVAEWDEAFKNFDENFFPSEKDIRRLAALQLKKMFIDDTQSTTSTVTTDPGDLASDIDEKSPSASLELSRHPSNISAEDTRDQLTSVVEENPHITEADDDDMPTPLAEIPVTPTESLDIEREGISHLDLAYPQTPDANETTPSETPTPTEFSSSMDFLDDPRTPTGPTATSPLESILAERAEKLQRPSLPGAESGTHHAESSGIPRLSERGSSRKSGSAISPPLSRTQSQPAGTIRRLHPGIRAQMKHADKMASESAIHTFDSVSNLSTGSVKMGDKKLSERLGLGSMKGHRKVGHSLIPRSIQAKRKEAKVSVSTLAKHFEQLSREFEKERMRDKRRRETKATQSRAFPKASSKPVVEVYKDVNEAVEEHEPTEDDEPAIKPTHPETEQTSVIGGLADLNTDSLAGDNGPHSPTETTVTADETGTEAETDDNQLVSQTGSDDEGAASDADHSLLDDIPNVADIADQLTGKSNAELELPLEIPKHEKSSLMKMLTNFWAERSASGWTPLDYPISSGDHIFGDVDVIVREDEPSSLIAFTLQTQDYIDKLANLRINSHANIRKEERPVSASGGPHDICEDGINQAEVETSLLRATGTHLAYSFTDRTARMQCKIFYAEQFDAVRRKCGVADRIVESLSRCLKWDSKGGKTKSVFLKTLDDRLVLKSLSPIETAAFLKFAPAYFNIMAEALFHDLPTVIAKMFGFYQITIKNPVTGIEIKWDVLVMENLFYDRKLTRIFDLKGSMRNRKIEATGEQNEVLLDENMVEFIYESPLFAREHSKKLLRAAIFNDTLFLQRNDVMDYSLMVAVDEDKKELVVGIIDVVRTYTWDKKLESWIKDRGFAGGGRNKPTVTSPKEYKNRFREAMNRYILQAPNSWHQYAAIETRPQLPQGQIKSEGREKEDAP